MGDTWAEDKEKAGFMMWWMNHASVVLRYERRLSSKNRDRYRSGSDATPEKPNRDKRPFYHIAVAHDKELEEAWLEKKVTNQDMHHEILELRRRHDEEDGTNKALFRRLDAKMNSTFNQNKGIEAKLTSLIQMISRVDAAGLTGKDQGAPKSQVPTNSVHKKTVSRMWWWWWW